METKNNLNIVLTGMPGSGKTYIGAKLAKLLVHFDYIDTDEEIEKSEQMSISEIFEKRGEAYFRKLETRTIENISMDRDKIISTGGGAFEKAENIHFLKKSGITFYLKASANELYRRVKNENHRPLLNNENPQKTIKDLLKKRERNYLKADFVIDTEGKQAYTILDNILSEYENYVKRTASC